MNLCRCERGHFYDKEKYAACPHCGNGNVHDGDVTVAFGGTGTIPNRPTPQQYHPPMAGMVTEKYQAGEHNRGGMLPVSDINANEETQALNIGVQTQAMSVNPSAEAYNQSGDPAPFRMSTGPVTQQLQEENDDVTVGFFGDDFFDIPKAAGMTDRNHSQQQAANKVSTPCVGWLVALSGEHIGADFRLKTGKNFIGRNLSNDIALTDDKSVSRERHAVVVYEPKLHMYLVQPGEASTLVYMNNEVVLTPVKMQAYDMITVGEVDLLFMPLCGERFNWGDLLEKMRKQQ